MIKPGDEPIPGYRVEELLGRGQFGQVWRAHSPGNTSIALKFLDLSGRHGWKEFRAIQRVKQIRHAHLMPIVALWLLDDQGEVIGDDAIETIAVSTRESDCAAPAAKTLLVEKVRESRQPAMMIVANLLANKTLGDRLRECLEEGLSGIPADELLRYMEEAGKGLDFLNLSAHDLGDNHGAIQHCDIKPDNIMLSGGSVVIADFGVAQSLAQARHDATATSLGGTPAYMAPECFASKPCRTSDQYSLAATYYELRTGKLPFAAQSYAEVYEAHKSGKLDFSLISEAEQKVLRKATATDPDRRFKSCCDMVAALRDAHYPRASLSEDRRARRVAAALAAAFLLVTALLAWQLTTDGPSDADKALVEIRQGNLPAALVHTTQLDSVDSIQEILPEFVDALRQSTDEQADDTSRDLLVFLRQQDFIDQLAPETIAGLQQRVAAELDRMLADAERLCAAWNPSPPGGAIPPELQVLKHSLLDAPAAPAGPHQTGKWDALRQWSAWRQRAPRMDLLRMRIQAREDASLWPELRGQLETTPIDPDALADQDKAYPLALELIVAPGAASIDQASAKKQLAQYAELLARQQAKPLAAWEQSQLDSRLPPLYQRIEKEDDWWTDEELFNIVKQVFPHSDLGKAASPAELRLVQARQSRREGDFAKARRDLAAAQDSASRNPAVALRMEPGFEDELFILDLVDDTVDAAKYQEILHARLAGSREGDFNRWRRIADQLHDEYDLSAYPKINSKGISPARAALVEALRLECLLSSGDTQAVSLTDWEPVFDALKSNAPLADYGSYLHALLNASELKPDARSLEWKEAADAFYACFQNRKPQSLLTAGFREKAAAEVITKAVKAWASGQPIVDADFGKGGLFSDLSAEVVANLALVQDLGRSSPSLDAQWLAAAVNLGQPAVEGHAAAILEKSQRLLSSANDVPTVSNLVGTIHLARARASLSLKQNDVQIVQDYAAALKRLYLDARLADEFAAPPRDANDQRAAVLWDVAQPAAAIADRLAGVPDANRPEVAAARGTIYLAAGLLYREDEIGDDVRQNEKKNPDDLAHDRLRRANELAPTAIGLTGQGLALLNLSTLPDDWRDQLDRLADRAIQLALEGRSTAARGLAHSLKSTALLRKARDDNQSLPDRVAHLAGALEHIDEACRNLQDPRVEIKSELADCLVTRAAINVEFAYFGSRDFAEKQAHLAKAAADAEAAAQINDRKHEEYAYNAWGNALEDLAYYVMDDPPTNFASACARFENAIKVAEPIQSFTSLRISKSLSAQRNLLRCRIRWAQSGALPSPEDERKLLAQAVKDAEAHEISLDANNADPKVIDARRAADYAELLFWLNRAYAELAARTNGAASETALANSDAALARAVQWARQAGAWEHWATYQVVYGNDQFKRGKWDSAAAAAREVIDAKKEHGQAVPWKAVFDASRLDLGCAKKQNAPDDAKWQELVLRFPENDFAALPYLLKVKISRADLDAANSDVRRQIDDLFALLAKNNSPASETTGARIEWLDCQGNRALRRGESVSKTNKQAALAQYKEAAEKYKELLTLADGVQPPVVKASLDQLRKDPKTWRNLKRWEKLATSNHLSYTWESRHSLLYCLTAMGLIENDKAALGQVKESMKLIDPEVLPVSAPAEWKKKFDELAGILNR